MIKVSLANAVDEYDSSNNAGQGKRDLPCPETERYQQRLHRECRGRISQAAPKHRLLNQWGDHDGDNQHAGG